MIMSTFCFSVEQEQTVMTTNTKGDITISIAGSGFITIDWGDGTVKETHALSTYNNKENFADFTIIPTNYDYKHTYLDTISRKITITGGNITHLKAAFIPIKTLDVSKNIDLVQLFCGGSFLTKLDLRKNTKLTHLAINASKLTSLDISNNQNLMYLNCVGNRLEQLDVSNNTKLIKLSLYNNRLSSLDVSKNIKLETLTISYNNFNDDEINNLFESLHANKIEAKKNVNIVGNPGTSESNQNIALDKGWIVTKKW